MLALALCLLACGCSAPDVEDPKLAARDRLLEIGRNIYQAGLGIDGQPIRAKVTGDVEILATQFSCNTCHGISGMGSMEASYIVPIIAGKILFNPAVQPARPAYDVTSLSKLLHQGVTPAGRQLDTLMPRFVLTDEEVAGLTAYLESLSVGPSPGVDRQVIRLATVVTSQTSDDVRSGVLEVLNTFVEEKNRQTRQEGDRWDRGTTPESQLPSVYRDWTLDVWELTGTAENWAEQLQTQYDREPVFALLGGLIDGGEDPLAMFCEQNRLPCILPSVAFPNVPADATYSVYFSRGIGLEADLIAGHAHKQGISTLVQLYCDAVGELAASRVGEVFEGQTRNLTFDCSDPLALGRLVTETREVVTSNIGAEAIEVVPDVEPGTAVVLWLDQAHLAQLGSASGPFSHAYFSSTFLNGQPGQLPGRLAAETYLAHPYVLPGKVDPAYVRFLAWTRTRGIEITHPLRQSEAFFAALVMNDGAKHLDRYLVREYLIDLIGHMQGMSLFMPFHARSTFGPRQAFLTKGGYVLPVRDGLVEVKEPVWINP